MSDSVNSSTQALVDPESLQGLIVLREVGLIRHDVDIDNQHQCSAWGGSIAQFDQEGRLIYLDLGGCRLRKGWPEGVAAAFETISSLKTLNLGGTDLPLKDTLQVLQSTTTLKSVHLGGNGLGDAGMQAISREWLPEATHLKALDLRYNDITEAGCEALCKGLSQQSSLIKLYLEGNRIQDQGAQALAQFLETNKSLQELFLGANSIGAVGGTALAECLKTNKTMSKLYLEGNSIGPNGAEAFTNVLLECNGDTSLKHLFVDNNEIGKEGSRRLAKALNSATAIGGSLLEG